MTPSGVVRKSLLLSQRKIDRAKKILETKTETETIEWALDLVGFPEEVVAGIERIAGSGAIQDVHARLGAPRT